MLTLTRPARDLRPGTTILVGDHPATIATVVHNTTGVLIVLAHATPDNVVTVHRHFDADVTVAPLAPVDRSRPIPTYGVLPAAPVDVVGL